MIWRRSGFRSDLRTGWLLVTAHGFHVSLAIAVALNLLSRVWVGATSLPTFVTPVPSIDVVAAIAVVALTPTYVDRWADWRRASVQSIAATAAATFVATQVTCLLAVAGTGYPHRELMPWVLCGASVAAVLSCLPKVVLWLPMLVLAYAWLRASQYHSPLPSTLWWTAGVLVVASGAVYAGTAERRSGG